MTLEDGNHISALEELEKKLATIKDIDELTTDEIDLICTYLKDDYPMVVAKVIGYSNRKWLPKGYLRQILMAIFALIGLANLVSGSAWCLLFFFIAANFSAKVVLYEAYYLGRSARFIKDTF